MYRILNFYCLKHVFSLLPLETLLTCYFVNSEFRDLALVFIERYDEIDIAIYTAGRYILTEIHLNQISDNLFPIYNGFYYTGDSFVCYHCQYKVKTLHTENYYIFNHDNECIQFTYPMRQYYCGNDIWIVSDDNISCNVLKVYFEMCFPWISSGIVRKGSFSGVELHFKDVVFKQLLTFEIYIRSNDRERIQTSNLSFSSLHFIPSRSGWKKHIKFDSFLEKYVSFSCTCIHKNVYFEYYRPPCNYKKRIALASSDED